MPGPRTEGLDDDQRAYVAAWLAASDLMPTGWKTAHNTGVLADRIWEARRRR